MISYAIVAVISAAVAIYAYRHITLSSLEARAKAALTKLKADVQAELSNAASSSAAEVRKLIRAIAAKL
jgi:hypothetical protein